MCVSDGSVEFYQLKTEKIDDSNDKDFANTVLL